MNKKFLIGLLLLLVIGAVGIFFFLSSDDNSDVESNTESDETTEINDDLETEFKAISATTEDGVKISILSYEETDLSDEVLELLGDNTIAYNVEVEILNESAQALDHGNPMFFSLVNGANEEYGYDLFTDEEPPSSDTLDVGEGTKGVMTFYVEPIQDINELSLKYEPLFNEGVTIEL